MKNFQGVYLLIIAGLLSVHGLSQTPKEKRDFLQKNISVWVLMDPNTDTPDFYSVKPTGVFLDTDGIIMGKKSNNGMDKSALFLSALFKDGSKKINGGDQVFQDNVYNLLKALARPVELFFINDISQSLDSTYLAQYGYYTRESDGQYYLTDGVYKASDPSNSAGDIVVGAMSMEYDLDNNKMDFVYLLGKLLLQEFSFTPHWFVSTNENKNPPSRMYQNDPLIYTMANTSKRSAVKEGAAYALAIKQSVVNSEETRRDHYEWLGSGAFFVTESQYPAPYKLTDVIPPAKVLNNRIRATFSPGYDTGWAITNPPFGVSDKTLPFFKIYSLNHVPPSIVTSIKGFLAIYFEMVLHNSLPSDYCKSLAAATRKLERVGVEDHLGILVEQLCQGDDEKTIEQRIQDKTFSVIQLFPLAVLDVFLEFPMEGNLPANLSKFDPGFYGVFSANSISRPLLEEYFKWRPRIYQEATKANLKMAVGFRNTGYENVIKIINAIKDFLVVNG